MHPSEDPQALVSEPVTLEKVTELAPAESVITVGRVLPEPVE